MLIPLSLHHNDYDNNQTEGSSDKKPISTDKLVRNQ